MVWWADIRDEYAGILGGKDGINKRYLEGLQMTPAIERLKRQITQAMVREEKLFTTPSRDHSYLIPKPKVEVVREGFWRVPVEVLMLPKPSA